MTAPASTPQQTMKIAYQQPAEFAEPAITTYFAAGASVWIDNQPTKRGLIDNTAEKYNGWDSPNTDAVARITGR